MKILLPPNLVRIPCGDELAFADEVEIHRLTEFDANRLNRVQEAVPRNDSKAHAIGRERDSTI